MTDLVLGGRRLQSVLVERSVRLQLSEDHFVLIASPFSLDREGMFAAFSPEEDFDEAFGPIRQLIGRVVVEATADDSGALRIRFGDGAVLQVPSDDAYEAWNVSGPGGALVVCMPGGELAAWNPDTYLGDA